MCHALAQIPTCMETVASGKQTRVQQKKKICSGDRLGSKCCVAVHVWVKTAPSPVQQHNELPVHIGSLSRLSRNKQWPVDNGSLVLLSSSSGYIRATGRAMVCFSGFGTALWSVKNAKRSVM